MVHTVPDGFRLKGTSTLYGDDGSQKLQWVKSQVDQDRQQELMNAAFAALAEELPRVPPIKRIEGKHNRHLLNLYTITDYHLGMLSYEGETGENWDTDMAEALLVRWFSTAIKQAPNAPTGVFAQLGDYLHFDSLDSVTPTNGNILDADTRFQRLVRVAIRVTRVVINLMLKKYKKVIVLMCEGNHDLASSIWLREWLAAIYEKEPRVVVNTSADPYYLVEHGKTSLFFHHGHKKNLADLDSVFAAKFRDVFGRTKFSYGHTGHYHHNKLLESNLMTIEQHRTLAAKDSFASRGGWLSGRDAKVITYHKEFGEVGRVIISPEMVEGK